MKQFSKKPAIWILLILITLVIVIACIQIGKLWLFRYSSFWMYTANYEEYAVDFNVVKNYIEVEFPSESKKCLLVSYNDSVGRGIGLFDIDTDTFLQLPSDVRSSLEKICDNGFSHKDAKFDTIRIHEGRISFCIENGQYALVYSPRQQPSWVNLPSEDDAVKVKSIGNGWYHIVIDPK